MAINFEKSKLAICALDFSKALTLVYAGPVSSTKVKGSHFVAEVYGFKYYVSAGTGNLLTSDCVVPAWSVKTIDRGNTDNAVVVYMEHQLAHELKSNEWRSEKITSAMWSRSVFVCFW